MKKTAEPFATAKPVTADTKRPIPGYFWSRDGKYILFVQDKAGDENYNVYAVNPADSPAAGQDVAAARNLTDAKGVRAVIYAVPRSEPDAIYVGLNDRDAAWHDLYKVKISTGERTLIRKNTERITGLLSSISKTSCDSQPDRQKTATRKYCALTRTSLRRFTVATCLSRVDQFAITKMANEFTSKQTRAATSISSVWCCFNPATGKKSSWLNRIL